MSLPATTGLSPLCPYCHVAVVADRARRCPTCAAPHHAECWREGDGCAVALCTSGPKLPYLGDPTRRLPPPPPRRLTINLDTLQHAVVRTRPSPRVPIEDIDRRHVVSVDDELPLPPRAPTTVQIRYRRVVALIVVVLVIGISAVVAVAGSRGAPATGSADESVSHPKVSVATTNQVVANEMQRVSRAAADAGRAEHAYEVTLAAAKAQAASVARAHAAQVLAAKRDAASQGAKDKPGSDRRPPPPSRGQDAIG